MKRTRMAAVAMPALIALLGCHHALRSAPEQIASWTVSLRDAQPDDAFAAAYRFRRNYLVFVGAHHATSADSLTFQIIKDAYASFAFQVVIVEGPRWSDGPNPSRLLSWVERQHEINGFVEGGEIVPATIGARTHNATVWGGEPDDTDVEARILAQGFSREDILGFYTLRSVPQWMREEKISNAGDVRVKDLIVQELVHNRERLRLPFAV